MDSESSDRYVSSTVEQSVKILVVGAFGVGKTTLIGSVSEIMPLRTEETMTAASVGVDSLAGLDSKSTTTVAMDFGRITISPEIVLYLFGTPGQKRFWNLWEGLSDGSVGALVIVDPRRLEDSFEVFDQLELRTRIPFAVAVNEFPDSPRYEPEQLRDALDLLPETPVVYCDARRREDSANALVTLVQHALEVRKQSKALA
ncbi:GTP-binding protein [Saccharomonospora halophila]|uniref:GTP-binding protein n=1 Tax=Saccharomonospora halophila TaxID=129922 RepID=UPI0003A4618D|nr:ATP/GTP-binding protein [Saccharomonospora halophila]